MTDYRYTGVGDWVKLDSDRIAWCWQQGYLMRADAIQNGRQDHRIRDIRHGNPGYADNEVQAISLHADAVMGEFAVAVVLGIQDYAPKLGVGNTEPDIGEGERGIDVRAARNKSYGLWVRGKDQDRPLVFTLLHKIPQHRPLPPGVRYTEGSVLVMGWIWPSEARRHPEWLRDFGTGRPREHCVHQSELHPLRELIRAFGYPGRVLHC